MFMPIRVSTSQVGSGTIMSAITITSSATMAMSLLRVMKPTPFVALSIILMRHVPSWIFLRERGIRLLRLQLRQYGLPATGPALS